MSLATTAQVVVKSHRNGPFFAHHPWVLDSSVARVEGEPRDGDLVDLVTSKGQWIAHGVYNGRSRIRVRLYSWDAAVAVDDGFWLGRLRSAVELRKKLGLDEPAGAARVVFSEGDGLSGLIVDRFADWLVVQVTALAIAQRLELLLPALCEATGARGVYLRVDRHIAETEGIEIQEGLCRGEPAPAELRIEEGGLQFRVDPGEGQKTGYYLDQRENRAAAARMARGARILDVCCYSGGFGLTALRQGGAELLGIDSSGKALEWAKQNAIHNQLPQAEFQAGDCFTALEELAAAGRRFDMVILDPPRFAGSRKNLDAALRAYHRLNRQALAVLEPGGTLVTCSCSGHVTRFDFFDMLVGVAQKTRREIQVLEQRGAAADHPVLCSCPESEYLKCFICRVW